MPRRQIVKICGLSTEATLDAALDAGAEMIGLVFFEKSPRHVSMETAAALAARARGRAEIVALTVNADDALIKEIVQKVRPDWLQLHGGESPGRCAALRAAHGIRVMKALGISAPEDIKAARAYVGHVDRLLFDAKPPKGAELPGGNGLAFDWTLLKGLDLGPPLMLSGGLAVGTVADAIRISGIAAVDVSSGVERARGEKDPDLIREFVAAARSAAKEELGA
ncbi:phosphoribosylanthranilate isomerase [Stappia taiwanensis]|uniref:N-(5'-phosphoribosyl)anthranilate isomerase n=1 Tax=Stappia taiwanensis TaxID=992267 RepID=A0A838Y218_9HYPH|nr:phosphoribosylanthranilate isomerase [Stappia taiwanensis]MBA4612980.1 phosphoribosylanthranilate isomerase [Stappia taiwanensis]GGF06335.1 N-(5'-phosphoribosyl)anthranilate isomerase [Stappia taiwanensis]